MSQTFKCQGQVTRYVRSYLDCFMARTPIGDFNRRKLRGWLEALEKPSWKGATWKRDHEIRKYFERFGIPFEANGFDLLQAEKVFSPKAKRWVLERCCSCKLQEGQEPNEAEESDLRSIAEDALDFLRRLPAPVRFRTGYSYAFDRDNPLKVMASDGDTVELEHLSDLDAHCDWEGEFLESLIDEDAGKFARGNVSQERHEAEALGL